ncbi:hypothetical protein ACFYXP_38005 [Streptomyces sp. NPDC002466]|uniref:hypothetical protein n=1 Tax=Streptomyces sp. NPDC002466 TaxID=3364646 RepID=UPI00368B21B9
MGYSRGYRTEHRDVWSRWTCERDGCEAAGTVHGDQHDDRAATYAARHQEETHRDALITDAIAALRTARAALDQLSSAAVTDVDTYTYRGRACVTPEAAADALGAWESQLTATLPEPSDPDERVLWKMAGHHGSDAICKHSHTP